MMNSASGYALARFLAADDAHKLDGDIFCPLLGSFDQLPEKSRCEVMQLLSALPDRDAAEAYMVIVNLYARSGAIKRMPLYALRNQPRHADVFFPALLDYLQLPQFVFPISLLCIDYFRAGLLTAESMAPYAGAVLDAYERIRQPLISAQREGGSAWLWDESYFDLRRDAGILLDMLGYFPTYASRIVLRDALGLSDPRLKHFAILSLLRLGTEIDPVRVAEVARSAEMRNWLYRELEALGRSRLYPEAYRTQAAFAESDLVNWLVYPTELGRAPDAIELMDVVSVDVTGDYDDEPPVTLDFYVFRFRCDDDEWAERGWMAGVSGPFEQGTEPTTRSHGETFSAFEPWDSRPAAEHVGNVRDILDTWRLRQSEQK